jgi:two-component system, NarL family, invasion response regulator UvrY
MDSHTALLRVLIADDFAPIRRRLGDLLADTPGVTVVGESASVAGTLAAIRRLAPDVVILDLAMPDGNGLDVLRQTRDDRPRPWFIVLTNSSGEEYRAAAAGFRADAFFDKAREFQRAITSIQGLAAVRRQPGAQELK